MVPELMRKNKDNNISTKKFINSFYIFEGLTSAFFYLPILVIYLSGLMDPIKVSILVSLKGISTLIFEIPTGFYADYISRKKSMQIGMLLTVFSLSIFIFSEKFIWLAIAQIFFGLAETFQSGADISWLYDNLLYLNQQSLYEKANQRIFQTQYAVLIFSYCIGGWLFKINSKLPFICSILFLLISCFICTTITEAPYKYSSNDTTKKPVPILAIIKKQNVKLWVLICFGSLIMGVMNATYVFLVPLVFEQTKSTSLLGISYSIAMLITLVLTDFSNRINNKNAFLFKNCPMLFCLVCGMSILLGNYAIAGVIYLVILRAIWGITDIVYTVLLNTLIEDSSIRATLISIGNSIVNGSSAIITIICGLLIEALGVSGAIMFVAIFVVFLGCLSVALLKILKG